jgi:hypothetical protein
MAAAPRSLVLYTMVSKACVQESVELNMLKKAEDAWHIGLRERMEDAVDRAIKVEGRASKESHLILRVEFSALGFAHFGTTCQGASFQFLPALHKKSYQGATDWGVWHLLCDLPLSLSDVMGNPLVSSDWMEIM